MRVLPPLALALALCLSAVAARAEVVLRWTAQSDALTLDPHAIAEGPTIRLLKQIYEPLVERSPDLSLVPALATSWTPLDQTTWAFTLREGIRFHDGAAFDAEDVVFSIGRALSETSNFRQRLGNVIGAEAVSPQVVHVRTSGPNPLLPDLLTTIFMMDQGWAARNDVERPLDFAENEFSFATLNANGTGAFRLGERRPGETTVLLRNEDWWGLDELPHNLDRVVLTPITSAAGRTAALLSGGVDLVLDPALPDLAGIAKTPGLKVVTTAQDRSIFLGVDLTSGSLRSPGAPEGNPLADVRVRAAIARSIDREAIRDRIMRGFSIPAGNIVTPGVRGYDAALDAPPPLDLEGARALLGESGYPDGFAVNLDCPNDRYINDGAICSAVAAMLAKVGIDVRLGLDSKSRYFPRLANGELDFFMVGWGASTMDSHDVLSHLVRSDGTWNRTGFSDEEVDALIDAAAAELDPEARLALLRRVLGIVREEVVYIPLHHQVLAWAMTNSLTLPIFGNDSPRFAYAHLHTPR